MRYFVAVVEEGSISRAAERLVISQQSLSAAIAGLEAKLGVGLLERSARGTTPTAAGQALAARAPQLPDAAARAIGAAQAAGRVTSGELRLRYGLDSDALVEPLISTFQDEHPGITVGGWTGADADTLRAVREGDTDAAFAWALDRRATGLVLALAAHEECVAAVPANDTLAATDSVAVTALGERPVVMFPRDAAPALWDRMAQHLRLGRDTGPPRAVQTSVSGQADMIAAAMRLHTIAPVSRSLTGTLSRPDVVFRPFDPPLRVALHIVHRPRPSPTLGLLLHHVESRLTTYSDS